MLQEDESTADRPQQTSASIEHLISNASRDVRIIGIPLLLAFFPILVVAEDWFAKLEVMLIIRVGGGCPFCANNRFELEDADASCLDT